MVSEQTPSPQTQPNPGLQRLQKNAAHDRGARMRQGGRTWGAAV